MSAPLFRWTVERRPYLSDFRLGDPEVLTRHPSQAKARAALLAVAQSWRDQDRANHRAYETAGSYRLDRIDDAQRSFGLTHVASLRVVDTRDRSGDPPRWRVTLNSRTVKSYPTKALAQRGLTAVVDMWRRGTFERQARPGQCIRNQDGSVRMQDRGRLVATARVEPIQ